MLNYVTLISAGFAMETVLAIVGMQWLPFFLILWIIREFVLSIMLVWLMIVNISVFMEAVEFADFSIFFLPSGAHASVLSLPTLDSIHTQR